MNRTKNIEKIEIWENNPAQYNPTKIVNVRFKFPCTWTTFTIDELIEIIRLWIKTEEARYPLKDGYKGRWLLYKKITDVFMEGL